MMAYVYYYPKGHKKAGEIYSIFHEFSGSHPPKQLSDDGTELSVIEVDRSDIPDPAELDLSKLYVDVDNSELL